MLLGERRLVERKSWRFGDRERNVGSRELIGASVKESSLLMEDCGVLLREEDCGMEDVGCEDPLRQLLSMRFSSDSSLLTE